MQDVKKETIEVISSNRFGGLAKGDCTHPFFSNDKTLVAFYTVATSFNPLQTVSKNEIVIRNIKRNLFYYPNTKSDGTFGNGECVLLEPSSLNKNLHSALFSPDGSKMLFLSKSTDLINGEFAISTSPSLTMRWYVKYLQTNQIVRVCEFNGEYGNAADSNEAIWLDNDRIVFTSFSNNLVPDPDKPSNDGSDVFLKNLATGNLSIVSKREDSHPSPYFTLNCFDISYNGFDIIEFFAQDIGYCLKNVTTGQLIEVKNLSGLLANQVVLANFFEWSSDGTKAIFRTLVDINGDTNGYEDDYLYDFVTDTIVEINESSMEAFGNSTSKNSCFNFSGNKVAFLSNSTNLDPSSNNETFNLYVKNLLNGDLHRVSNPFTNNNIDGQVYGYCWLSDDELCFTTNATNIESMSAPNTVKWYYKNISTSETILVNYYNGSKQFDVFNQYNAVLRKELFNNDNRQMLFVTQPITLSYATNSAGYNIYNIFLKTFKDAVYDFPAYEPIYAIPSEAINATLTSNESANQYTFLDPIQNTPTLSVIESTYVEKINSIQYRNINSSIRWMHVAYPEIPDTVSGGVARMGAGIFKGTATLADDLLSVKRDVVPSVINPVEGTLVSFEVKPSNNIVLITAGDDQFQICNPMVTLSATIRGYRIGHTFTWEQIRGTNVTLYQVNETDAYYIAGNTTDLVFRYYIDKGQPNEQFDDVTIFRTPTSFNVNNTSHSLHHGELFIYDSSLYVRSSNFTNAFDDNIPFNSRGEYIQANTAALEWELPIIFYDIETPFSAYYKSVFKNTKLQTHDGTFWIDTTAKTLLEERYYSPVTGVIRVGATYQEPFEDEFTLYNLPQYISPYISAKTLNSPTYHSSASLDAAVVPYVYILLSMNIDQEMLTNDVRYHSSMLDSNRVNLIYVLELQSFDQNVLINDVKTHSLNNIKFSVTRVNGGNIGG